MSEKTRIPLPTDLATRDATVSHDGLLQNLYEENTPIGPMVVKRPGLTNNIALGACVAQGSTFFNNNNYFICSNTLYVNPPPAMAPVCAVPGSVTTFGNANSNYFSIIDPITKNIWASETGNIHKVAVYNSTSGALITEVSIPSASGDTVGLFYLSATRKIFAVTTATFSTNNLFVINPDNFIIEQSLNLPGGAGWTGTTICLDNASTKVVIYNGNALSGGINFAVDYITYAVSPVDTYPDTGLTERDFVYAQDIPVFALLSPGAVVLISDFAGTKSSTVFNFFNDTSIVPVAYDSFRKYFWVFERTNKKLYFIPINGTLIGSSTFVANLPANPLQACYDSARDVLWATFDDGNLRQLSPTTGLTLKTFGGSSTFVIPALAGSRLFLRDNCTMIQGTGAGGGSFNVIGIQ